MSRCFYKHDKLSSNFGKTRQEKNLTMFRIRDEWREILMIDEAIVNL